MFKELFKKRNSIELLSDLNNSAIMYYKQITNGTEITDLEELKYFLLCLDRVYQEGLISPLRDFEYDDALEVYLDHGGEMIRGDMSSGNKAFHVYPNLKGTIKKVHYITEKDRLKRSKVKNHKSLEDWLRKVKNEYGELAGNNIELGFYTKYDGLSVILEVEDGKVKSAITRGDKELGMGEDKTNVFKYFDFSDICKKLKSSKFGLKCEALVSKENFESYNKKFGDNKLVDPRSAATSILNSDDPTIEELHYLTIMPLVLSVWGKEYPLPTKSKDIPKDIFDDWLEDTIHYDLITSFDLEPLVENIEPLIKKMTEDIGNLELPADGIVIRIETPKLIKALGRNQDECINNFERAYKFPPETAKTILLDIEQEIGLLGKVSFTAKVEPVKLKHKKIKSISLGSFARFADLHLAKGDEVYVRYDIIPYLTVENDCKKSGNPPIRVIDRCPYCHESLEMNPELSCTNPDCPSRIIGKIYNYCAKMNIEGIGEETVTTLFNHGFIKNILDLYTLEDKADELAEMSGFGKKMVENIIKAIKKVDKVPPHVLLGSIGIPSISRKVFKKILSTYKFKEVLEFTKKDIDALCKIEGVKEKTAKKIIEGLQENKDLITKLLKHIGLKEEKEKKYKATVCFTKVRNKAFEKFLNDQNILVADSLTKDTDLLITGPGESSKKEKAAKYGIPEMSISEAYKHFGYTQ